MAEKAQETRAKFCNATNEQKPFAPNKKSSHTHTHTHRKANRQIKQNVTAQKVLALPKKIQCAI